MYRLTNLDASFLRLEKPGSPMNVGGTLIFDAPAGQAMTFERLKAHVGSRIGAARVFHERLLNPALSLENPSWVADQPVDLDAHLRQATVREPITPETLRAFSETFFAEVLPRDRPLWNMLYVEQAPVKRGVRPLPNPGRFALLLKVHHAACDGVSAEALLTALLDQQPRTNRSSATYEPAQEATRPPGVTRSLRAAVRGAEWRELAGTAGTLGRRFVRRVLDPQERHLPHYFRAPQTPFNVPVGAERVFPCASLSLPTIKRIRRSVEGATVNDVVLTICGGALRRYLQETGGLPETSLVGMAPVSRRAAGQGHRQGNQVSSMLVALGTDIDDPLERLRYVGWQAGMAKAYNREMAMEGLLDALPAAGPALFLGAWSRLKLSRRTPPLFNVVITNVPGSPVPLYLDGAPLQQLTGMAGIYDGVGLVMVVTSYLDMLDIGISSTPAILSRPDRFVECLHESLAELAAAVPPEEVPAEVPGMSAQERTAARVAANA